MKQARHIQNITFCYISYESLRKATCIGFLALGCLILLGGCERSGDFNQDYPSRGILGKGPYQGDYWPTKDWRSCTPEEVGMDSELLRKMNEDMVLQMRLHVDVHSVHVIRKGYIVAEQYYSPEYSEDSLHLIFSCTKSILSAAYGIAMEKGHINNLDTALYDYFPDYISDGDSSLKEQISLYHALTMSDGLEWYETQYPYEDERNTFNHWRGQGGENQFILERPIANHPGSSFNYNSGISQLLATILENQCGMRLDSFVHQEIFTSLGIEDYYWSINSDGIAKGYSGVYLRPKDLAKFGLLYLEKGNWENDQVVPEAWVKESTEKHVLRGDIPGFYYGYQWWVHEDGLFAAVGFAGQFLMIIPEYDLVVLFTNDHNELDAFQMETPWRLLNEFIIPAIKN